MICPPTPENLERAVGLLQKGGCVGIPTETVYGLATDGFNAEAVLRVFEIKKRPSFDPLILHLPEGYPVSEVVENIPGYGRDLLKKFWPGPLTLVLKKKARVPDIVTAGLPAVAVRSPSHPVAQEVLRCFLGPLAAPSANRFGRISPTTARAVEEELGDTVKIILDGGACLVGIESTIVDCSGLRPVLLRQGAVSIEEIEAVVGPLDYGTTDRVAAPGMLKNHYAPRTPLHLSLSCMADIQELPGDAAYLFWTRPPSVSPKYFRVLTPRDEPREAAANLFACLRELDGLGMSAIYCDPVPQRGVGIAIADRLWRASQCTARWNGTSFDLEKRN